MNTTFYSFRSEGTDTSSSVADALGLGSLADDEIGIDPARLQAIYRHARNEDERRELYANDASFVRGWVRLDKPVAAALIEPLVPLDDEANLQKARRIAANNLEAQPWNDLLGIDDPPIRCRVKIHGTKFGIRFESPARKGVERINEQLPEIPAAKRLTPAGESEQIIVPPLPAAAQVLSKAGLPS